MDPLSLTASILTIAGALSATVKAASVFLEDSDDLYELASQITHLNEVMANFNQLDQRYAMCHIDLDLLKSVKVRLEAVQLKFDAAISLTSRTKQLKKFGKSLIMRQRKEIRSLTKSVAIVKDELSAAIQMTTLFTIFALHDQCADLTRDFEEMRSPVRNETEHEHDSDSNHTQANHDGQTCNSVADEDERILTEQFFDAASRISDSFADDISCRLPVTNDLAYSLKRSRTFFPEQYIIEQPSQHHMLIFTMSEFLVDTTSRFNRYYLLWPKDARRWIRVIVTASTAALERNSYLWCPTRLSYKTLPGLVQPQLQKLLHDVETYRSVTHVRVSLRKNAAGVIDFGLTQSLVHEDWEEAMAMDASRHVMDIEFQGLAQYLESEIITLACESLHFWVLVESELCLECKVPFIQRTDIDQQPVEDFMARMKLLLML